MLYLQLNMKILKLFKRDRLEKSKRGLDFYQESIEKVGRDQLKRLVDWNLNIPVFML